MNNQQPMYAPVPETAPVQNWGQPQAIPNATQPEIPNQVLQPTSQAIRPPVANASSFIPDSKTKEILDRTYPELTNALINLAIKKFAEDIDYSNYFVREEFKNIVNTEQASIQKEESTSSTKTESSGAGFSTW